MHCQNDCTGRFLNLVSYRLLLIYKNALYFPVDAYIQYNYKYQLFLNYRNALSTFLYSDAYIQYNYKYQLFPNL